MEREYIDSPGGEYLSWEKQNMDNSWRELCAQKRCRPTPCNR